MNTLGSEGSSADSECEGATVGGGEGRKGFWEGHLDFIGRKGGRRMVPCSWGVGDRGRGPKSTFS